MMRYRRRRTALFILSSIFAFFLFCFFVLYPPFREYPYEYYGRISVQRMIEKWGDVPFDPLQFKTGNPRQRAAMAAGIVRNQIYLGQPVELVFRDLGYGDVSEGPEAVSEYYLESSKGSWRNFADYYLEFSKDDKDRRVKGVYVVWRCCENPYASFWHKRLLKLE